MSTSPQATPSTRSTPGTTTPTSARLPVWKHGLAAALLASIATTVLAAAASHVGVSFANGTAAAIPLAGFAQLTLIFSLLGVAIAAVMTRTARRPRPTFVRTALALTTLSIVPDLTFGFDAGSAATLIMLHLIAATIVVPVLARRLAPTR